MVEAAKPVASYRRTNRQSWSSARWTFSPGVLSGSARGLDVGDVGNVPGAVVILIQKKLKESLNGAWSDIFGLSVEALFPDFDGFARAHGVTVGFQPDFPLGDPPSMGVPPTE